MKRAGGAGSDGLAEQPDRDREHEEQADVPAERERDLRGRWTPERQCPRGARRCRDRLVLREPLEPARHRRHRHERRGREHELEPRQDRRCSSRELVLTKRGDNNDYVTIAHDASTGAKLWRKVYNGPGNSPGYRSGPCAESRWVHGIRNGCERRIDELLRLRNHRVCGVGWRYPVSSSSPRSVYDSHPRRTHVVAVSVSEVQPGTRPACLIHLCISGPCASSRVFTLT